MGDSGNHDNAISALIDSIPEGTSVSFSKNGPQVPHSENVFTRAPKQQAPGGIFDTVDEPFSPPKGDEEDEPEEEQKESEEPAEPDVPEDKTPLVVSTAPKKKLFSGIASSFKPFKLLKPVVSVNYVEPQTRNDHLGKILVNVAKEDPGYVTYLEKKIRFETYASFILAVINSTIPFIIPITDAIILGGGMGIQNIQSTYYGNIIFMADTWTYITNAVIRFVVVSAIMIYGWLVRDDPMLFKFPRIHTAILYPLGTIFDAVSMMMLIQNPSTSAVPAIVAVVFSVLAMSCYFACQLLCTPEYVTERLMYVGMILPHNASKKEYKPEVNLPDPAGTAVLNRRHRVVQQMLDDQVPLNLQNQPTPELIELIGRTDPAAAESAKKRANAAIPAVSKSKTVLPPILPVNQRPVNSWSHMIVQGGIGYNIGWTWCTMFFWINVLISPLMVVDVNYAVAHNCSGNNGTYADCGFFAPKPGLTTAGIVTPYITWILPLILIFAFNSPSPGFSVAFFTIGVMTRGDKIVGIDFVYSVMAAAIIVFIIQIVGIFVWATKLGDKAEADHLKARATPSKKTK